MGVVLDMLVKGKTQLPLPSCLRTTNKWHTGISMLVLLQRGRGRSNRSNPSHIHLPLTSAFHDPDQDLGEASTKLRMADEEDHKDKHQHS